MKRSPLNISALKLLPAVERCVALNKLLSLELKLKEPDLRFTVKHTSFYNQMAGGTIYITLARHDYFVNGFEEPMIHEMAHHLCASRYRGLSNVKAHGPEFFQCLTDVIAIAKQSGIGYRNRSEYKSLAHALRRQSLDSQTESLLGDLLK